MQNASYVAPPGQPSYSTESYSQSTPVPTQRALPQGLSLTPEPDYGSQAGLGAPVPADDEPYYRDPKTGERIILPPGTVTIPHNPAAPTNPQSSAPHYVDPETGQQIPIKYFQNK